MVPAGGVEGGPWYQDRLIERSDCRTPSVVGIGIAVWATELQAQWRIARIADVYHDSTNLDCGGLPVFGGRVLTLGLVDIETDHANPAVVALACDRSRGAERETRCFGTEVRRIDGRACGRGDGPHVAIPDAAVIVASVGGAACSRGGASGASCSPGRADAPSCSVGLPPRAGRSPSSARVLRRSDTASGGAGHALGAGRPSGSTGVTREAGRAPRCAGRTSAATTAPGGSHSSEEDGQRGQLHKNRTHTIGHSASDCPRMPYRTAATVYLETTLKKVPKAARDATPEPACRIWSRQSTCRVRGSDPSYSGSSCATTLARFTRQSGMGPRIASVGARSRTL